MCNCLGLLVDLCLLSLLCANIEGGARRCLGNGRVAIIFLKKSAHGLGFVPLLEYSCNEGWCARKKNISSDIHEHNRNNKG